MKEAVDDIIAREIAKLLSQLIKRFFR